jgi:hypothetical protein
MGRSEPSQEEAVPQKRIPTIVRYLGKVDQSGGPEGCWPWTGAKDPDGYGIFWDGTYRANGSGHYVRVTRWTYQQFVGPIPDRMNLCHRCDNPPCVNPGHLFLGTHADNHADREAKGRGGQWMTRGEWQAHHKLTADQVREIRRRYAAGGISAPKLAAEYGVNPETIRKAILRRTWAHID